MNTLDLYEFEINKPPTPVPASDKPTDDSSGSTSATTAPASEPSLNEEVNQAIGQLGRFWGGFRASSQSAFQLARKDFGQVVQQARAEIGKIATEVSVTSNPTTPAPASESTTAPMDVDSSAPGSDVKGKGKEKDPSEYPSSSENPQSPPETPSIPTSIFARLQARMPPNLQPSAIAATLSNATSAAPAVDLANIRSTLIANIQRAQDNLPLAQAEKLAEGYLHKSQELFKEAGEFLKEAVKVVPPPVGADGKSIADESMDVIVTGTDVWMFPSPIGTAGWGAGAAVANDRQTSATPPLKDSRASISSLKGKDAASFTGHMSQATRSEALLRRLKYDPEMLRLDPSQDQAVSSEYADFVEEVNGKLGGISGDTMVTRISDAVKAGPAGELDADAKALIDNRDLLVPSEMSNDAFWLRYFFRVQQITKEEEKRKALLANVSQGEDEFSWEDDEEEQAPNEAAQATTPTAPPGVAALSAAPDSPAPQRVPSNIAIQSLLRASSPRPSEDGSYDIVGEDSVAGTRVQSPAITPSAPVPPVTAPAKEETKSDDGSEDSDWE